MSKAKTQMIKLRDIVVPPNRMRQLRPEKVDEIAESIAARGQLQPIIVRPRGDTDYLLVGGLHRLEAVRKLGHEAIECRVLDGMDADQRFPLPRKGRGTPPKRSSYAQNRPSDSPSVTVIAVRDS